MEIILASTVVIAVIFFGALLSIGNERQRRAIDALREQVVLWAVQDLRIKQEKLALEVRVDDPHAWFEKAASRVVGYKLDLKAAEIFDAPTALVCELGEGTGKAIFSPCSPADVRRLRGGRKSRLSQYSQENPLYGLSRGMKGYEIPVLDMGMVFDKELQLAWKGMTGQNLDPVRGLWLYMVS